MADFKLFFKDEKFVENADLGGEIAVLEFDEYKKKARLLFVPKVSMIERRKAERQAQSLMRIGYVIRAGKRIGVGFDLEIL